MTKWKKIWSFRQHVISGTYPPSNAIPLGENLVGLCSSSAKELRVLLRPLKHVSLFSLFLHPSDVISFAHDRSNIEGYDATWRKEFKNEGPFFPLPLP
jgi:hypothetical protein